MFIEIYNFFLVIELIKTSVKNKTYIKYIYLIFFKTKIKICKVYMCRKYYNYILLPLWKKCVDNSKRVIYSNHDQKIYKIILQLI